MARRKRHHSVPKHYLDRFSGERGLIWLYPTDASEAYQSRSHNIAVEKYLYSMGDAEDPRNDAVEVFLGDHVDGPSARPLHKLTAGETLDHDDRMAVARFIAFQELRIPGMRDNILGFVERIGLDLVDLVASNEKALEAAAAEIDVDPEVLRLGYEDIQEGRMEIKANNASWLQSMIEVAHRSASLIANLPWTLTEAPEGFEFVTSDRPVVKVLTDRRVPPLYAGGWISPSAESTLTLDPGHVLLIAPHGTEGRARARPPWCRDVNRRTVALASRFVFSRSRLDWVPKRLRELRRKQAENAAREDS